MAIEAIRLPRVDSPSSEVVAPKGVPSLAALALIALLVPIQFEVSGLMLNPSRVLFLLITVPLGAKLMMGRYGRVLAADYMIVGFVFWTVLAIYINNPDRTIEYGGAQALTTLGAYLCGRASIRSPTDFQALVRFYAKLVIIVAPFAFWESITGTSWLRIIDSIPGISTPEYNLTSPRLGLERAQLVFGHPILFGIFASLSIALSYVVLSPVMSGGRRLILLIIVTLTAFLSLSSGPLLSIAIQYFLLLWAFAARYLPGRWMVLFLISTFTYVILDLLSSRPAYIAVLSRLTFSIETLYYRSELLKYGLTEIMQNPIFGIGFSNWQSLPLWMQNIASVDNHWLLIAVTFGPMALILFLGSITWAMFQISRRPFDWNCPEGRARTGWMIMMSSLIISAITVALFGTVYSIVIFLFSSGLWMQNWVSNKQDDCRPDASQATPEMSGNQIRYTRF